MELKDIKLKIRTIRKDVNLLISEWVILEDEIYLGAQHKHNWKCKCGNIIEGRTWNAVKDKKRYKCNYCLSNRNRAIRYSSRHILLRPRDSFAKYHIDNTDKDFLDKYWDYEKNTVDPFTISPSSNTKVWIKCQEKDYHGSYEAHCFVFTKGHRCSYCNNMKVHPSDSFGMYLEDNNILNLWSNENKISPYSRAKYSNKKVLMLCDKKDYHNDNGGYEITCANFVNKCRCSYCNSRGKKVHPYDSFGYHNLDKAQSWHVDNNISPFRVAKSSNRKFKFTCETCGTVFNKKPSEITLQDQWCPECSKSKGEKEVVRILKLNNIKYIPQKEFEGLIGLKNGNLSYDFYLPEYNRLIEYQGDQHRRFVKGFHIDKEGFEKQQEHDRLKREYAINNGYGKVIEIWEEDFENIESILQKEINHSNPTKSGS